MSDWQYCSEHYHCQMFNRRLPVCWQYTKEDFDVNCRIPCEVSNCTKNIWVTENCIYFQCWANNETSPLIPISPIPDPCPAPSNVWGNVLTLILTVFVCLLFWGLVQVRKVIRRRRAEYENLNATVSYSVGDENLIILENRSPSINPPEPPCPLPPPNPVDSAINSAAEAAVRLQEEAQGARRKEKKKKKDFELVTFFSSRKSKKDKKVNDTSESSV